MIRFDHLPSVRFERSREPAAPPPLDSARGERRRGTINTHFLTLTVLVAAPAVAQEEPDIVVIGKRLESVTASIARDARGKLQCAVSQSTGLARLDDALCKTATKCVRKGARTADAINACVAARKPALLDEVKSLLKARRS